MVGLIDVYHITDGHVRIAEIDGNTAVSQHPLEWSKTPWTKEDAAASRSEMKRQYDEAQAAGRPLPAAPPPEPAPPTPEEQAAIDEHTKAVAEANERLKAFRERKEAERLEAEQILRDEMIVNSPPPQPDPTARRPFGRKGEPTEAEKKMMEKKADKDSEAERNAKDKAEAEADRKTRAGETSPNPISPVNTEQKTPQQIAEEKAYVDRVSGAKVIP